MTGAHRHRALLAEAVRRYAPRHRVVEGGILRTADREQRCDVIVGASAARSAQTWDVDRDGPVALVVQFRAMAPSELHAGAGVEQFVTHVVGVRSNEVRIWDRMGWAFEERDVVEWPCACEPLGCVWRMTLLPDGAAALTLSADPLARRS